MAQGKDGADILLIVDTGGGNYVAVGGETEFSHDKERDKIETTAKSDDHKDFIYSKMDNTISLTALYIVGDSAQAALDDAIDNKNNIVIRRREDGNDVEQADAQVDSISKNYPDGDSSEFSAEIQMLENWQSI